VELTYDLNDNVVRSEFHNYQGVSIEITYQYKLGNLVQSISHVRYNLPQDPAYVDIDTTRYEYDWMRINPRKVLMDNPLPEYGSRILSRNLLKKESHSSSQYVKLYHYEYNSREYPIKEIWELRDNEAYIIDIEYLCP